MRHRRPAFPAVPLLALLLALAALPAAAEFRLEKTFDLAPDRLVVKTDGGSVEVTGDGGDGVRVLITGRDAVADEFDFRFEPSDAELRIEAERRGGGGLSRLFDWSGDRDLHFEIHVPAATALDVSTSGGGLSARGIAADVDFATSGGGIRAEEIGGSIEADTSGGGIHVADVGGDAFLDTSGGGISAERVDGRVVAETSGGGIRMRDVMGDVDADTSGGAIEIEEAGGRVVAESSGGPVSVVFAAGNDRGGHLSTSGGGVTARVDPSVGLDIDASTSSGRVDSELPVAVVGRVGGDSLRGTLNGGGARLVLRSSGGSVRLRSR